MLIELIISGIIIVLFIFLITPPAIKIIENLSNINPILELIGFMVYAVLIWYLSGEILDYIILVFGG